MKLSRILLFAFVLLPIIVPDIARADVVVFKDGKIIECLVREERKTGYLVWLYTESGIESEYEIPLAEVKEVIKKKYWGQEYKKLLATTDFTKEESVRAFADWCKQNNLDSLALKYGRRADELRNRDIVRKYPEVACEKCEGGGSLSCKTCVGKGSRSDKCPDCKGEGRVKCPKCKGEGRIKCKKCKGTGKITVKKRVTTSGGGSSDKTVQMPCSSCRKGKVRCRRCISKKTIKCSKCRGSAKIKTTCKDCGGRPTTACADCRGTGIDPMKYEALQARLAKENEKPPVIIKPVGPDRDQEEIARRKLLARTRHINSYHKSSSGEITDEYLDAKIHLYPELPVQKGDWPLLEDNDKVYILEDDPEPKDGGNGKLYYHVKLDSTGHKGWVDDDNMRKERLVFISCEPCEGQGHFECPACQGGKRISLNEKLYDCKLCARKGRMKCRHCYGSGKLIKK
ncbi:MAG: hypothetical protein E3J72_02060 [Planctomycetota bacterium]|nr:MAG: hypothetical protein E3J72_02060 [Planctomycetota bacterium]